jgi:signal transduction histidine kinase
VALGAPTVAAASASSAATGAAKATDLAASDAAVDMVVGGQHIRINVPAHANADEVRDAINEAKDSLVQSIRDAEQARSAADQEARDKANEEKDAAKAGKDDDGNGDDDDEQSGNDDQRRTMHERTINQVPVQMLAVWWILGSILIKVTYKGRIQAEVKAAVATETAEAESLRRQVLEARMAMMQAQVEPHFLFNTLASIDHLIEFDPKRASQMQRNLISLLRASMPSMRSTDSGLRPLDLELAVVRPYLEILKVRMEERLTTEIDVPDGLLSAEFPPMMIQTLVENSIKHGLEPKAEGGHLSVRAEIRHGKLAVTVCDTGLGFEAAAQGTTHGTGVGLANIRERLALLYGAKASLTIANNPVGGTIVTITVPYTAHTDSSSDEGAKA